MGGQKEFGVRGCGVAHRDSKQVARGNAPRVGRVSLEYDLVTADLHGAHENTVEHLVVLIALCYG